MFKECLGAFVNKTLKTLRVEWNKNIHNSLWYNKFHNEEKKEGASEVSVATIAML